MTGVLEVLAITLGLIMLWGAVAPRAQWRVLNAWSVSDPYSNEPGGAAYGWRRAISALGVLGLGAILALSVTAALPVVSQSVPEPSAVELMWGKPSPSIVNRVVKALSVPPAGLVEVGVIDYQEFGEAGTGTYLAELADYALLGKKTPAGYIGGPPDIASTAVESADLVVHVRGPILCIPRAAVILESQETVTIAIYYGLPNPVTGGAVDHLAGCPVDASLTASVLIPIELNAPLGDRAVETLEGDRVPRVALID